MSQLHSMEARIQELSHRFDVPALIDALRAVGYRADEIRFRSEPTLRHSPSLVHSVEFRAEPRQAIVTINLGLLNSQGPLPMYFFRLLSEQRDSDMTEFLWFFDQYLLSQRCRSLFPERDKESWPGWTTTQKSMLRLARLTSPSGVHWLHSQVFPELEVVVRRGAGERMLRTEEFRVSGPVLGDGATLGGLTTLPVDGTEVLLLCPEEAGATAALIIESVQRRLTDEVLPLLDQQNPYLFLRVYLVFRGALGTVGLSKSRYLGVNRITTTSGQSEQIEQLLLFAGEVRTAATTDHLNFQLTADDKLEQPRARSNKRA